MDVGVRYPGGFDEAAQCLHWDLFTHAVGDDHCNLLASLDHTALRSPDGQTCLGSCDLRILRSADGCDNSAATGLAASLRIGRNLLGLGARRQFALPSLGGVRRDLDWLDNRGVVVLVLVD